MPRLGEEWMPNQIEDQKLVQTIQSSVWLAIFRNMSLLGIGSDSKKAATPPTIILIDSPSFIPVTYFEEKHYIEVPIGFFFRIGLLIHLLMRDLDNEKTVLLMVGHQYGRDSNDWYLPERFMPVFGKYSSSISLYEGMKNVTYKLPLKKQLHNLRNLAVKYAFLSVVLHECSHINLNHISRIRKAKSDGYMMKEKEFFSVDETRKIFEIQADLQAADWTLHTALTGRYTEIQIASLIRGWLSVFSLFDTPERYLGSFDKTSYCHPVVRYEFIRGRWLHMVKPASKEIFSKLELQEWKNVIKCLDGAVLEAFCDDDDVIKNCGDQGNKELLPLHSFKMGHTGLPIVDKSYDSQYKLMQRYWKEL